MNSFTNRIGAKVRNSPKPRPGSNPLNPDINYHAEKALPRQPQKMIPFGVPPLTRMAYHRADPAERSNKLLLPDDDPKLSHRNRK